MHFVQLVLFLHVAAALWLAVGVLGSLAVRGRLRTDLDIQALTLGIDLLARLHRLYTLPGIVAAGLLGFSLVTATGYRFVQLWIAGAALIFVLLFHLSVFGITPRLAALSRAARLEAAGKVESGTARTRVEQRTWRRLLDLQALLLLLLVLLMTVKP